VSPVLPVIAGYLVDGLIGDPHWLPHPVRGVGWLIQWGDRRLNRGAPWMRLALGGTLVVAVVSVTALAAWALGEGARQIHPLLGDLVTALGVGVLLARRSLAEEAGDSVYKPLAAGDLAGARRAVSLVVGRDTEHLDTSGVARAAVETMAENASDGVVAPLLFALAFGLPGIVAYKAINTLDSMIGHQDESYLYFGRVAARVDDLANWIPARVTMVALVAAAALTRRDAAAAWRTAKRDARKHCSPNAGWPEAAMAGALGVCLGGLNWYGGEPHRGPMFNPNGRPPAPADIQHAVALMQNACHLTLAAGIFVHMLISF